MIKALIYTTDETTYIWYIQFITLFAQALFKGAVENLFSFMASMSFGFDTLLIGLQILQYQRRLYIYWELPKLIKEPIKREKYIDCFNSLS